jgi:hypothetical protein
MLLVVGLHADLHLEILTTADFSKGIPLRESTIAAIGDHVLCMATGARSERLVAEVISVLCN